MNQDGGVVYVAIGRNEGARLVACLASLPCRESVVVYVDSGSTDQSIEAARAAGAHVVELDMSRPFTAARARNAGFERAKALAPQADYVQFIDGDCELVGGWVDAARRFLTTNPAYAVACGRRREQNPQESAYNRLCDIEWDTPIGEATACGGDALMRVNAFEAVGGFRASLLAGEEPELCVRFRAAGWKIMRLDADMARHDAAITRFAQWWRRAERAGHAYAEVSNLHRHFPHGVWRKETVRAVAWAGLAPAALLAAALFGPEALIVLALYPLQAIRIAARNARVRGVAPALLYGGFIVLGKFAETRGAIDYWAGRSLNNSRRKYDYKIAS